MSPFVRLVLTFAVLAASIMNAAVGTPSIGAGASLVLGLVLGAYLGHRLAVLYVLEAEQESRR